MRADVQEMIRGDINAAQDEKDRLEELQRKDKKLRVAHGKSLTKKKWLFFVIYYNWMNY